MIDNTGERKFYWGGVPGHFTSLRYMPTFQFFAASAIAMIQIMYKKFKAISSVKVLFLFDNYNQWYHF